MSRNGTVPSTPSRANRTTPFTPKRSLSVLSTSSSTSSTSTTTDQQLNARLSRANQPVLLNSTHKKYKATLSVESRSKTLRPKTPLNPVPGTPTKKDGTHSRPRTPVTPRSRSGAESPMLSPSKSEMDVSNVDPEQVLVDSQTVEPGDVSGEIDEAWLKAAELNHGKQDKVMVSIRIRPTDSDSAWIPNQNTNSLKLDPNFAKHATTTSSSLSSSFNFDAVLTGSANKPVYTTVARSHVQAAMEGYNAVIFAYGQTASGKTFTLSGDETEPGIIPRAMRDVFGFIKRTPEREYLLRCSYLEIYNETVVDLLAPPMMAKSNPVQIQGGAGGDVILTPLREEVVTSLKGVKDVLKRGEGNRRTACTDWNERSSRSHSVFRLVVESRERGASGSSDDDDEDEPSTPASAMNGRQTPGFAGRQTPGLGGRQTPGPNGRHTPGLGGPRLQARGGRSVQTSVLSLIDLAGSEKATSDKERTREGKYINTSLLTLGTVIGTLADNAAKNKADHVPYRNSKLTRMLQPSLSGNARISVICTINPDAGAISESMSTLLFAKRIKNVQLNAKKKEVVDTDALIERYRKEIEELKARLAEREAEVPARSRRLSAREQIDESRAMRDLNGRIQQLTKLILTSATVEETKVDDDDERAASPVKIDFDMSPYQLQQELLAARLQIESQANQILSLEASLLARPPLPADASENEKDKLIAEQTKTIRELEIVVRGYEENLGEPLRKVKEDVEKEWMEKLEEEQRKTEKSEKWAEELVKALEKEKKARQTLEEERRALATFVTRFDSLGLGQTIPPTKLKMPTHGGAMATYNERRQSRSFSARLPRISDVTVMRDMTGNTESSPMRLDRAGARSQPSLFDQDMLEELGGAADVSFDELEVERHLLDTSIYIAQPLSSNVAEKLGHGVDKTALVRPRDVFGDKENILP
ncbi:Kinesin-related protein 11 [Psilocybe cubensis]|uniref:Kinesin-like protein n=2 Tax=Psilocybe cubensis TaxID=181762 RepID=A0A8H7XST1_PSICU|nr:Kinesin-related protein 11 [Psilocybe cubensis]KAH9480830.1 Kinesin-related protein 11 [Psilocybe cubensis]